MATTRDKTILCSACAERDEDGRIITKGRHATADEARACKGVPNPDAERMLKWALNKLAKNRTPEEAFGLAVQTLAEIGHKTFVETE